MARKSPLNARLKHKVIIQEFIDTVDLVGGPTGNWSDYITRYASIVPLNGSEFFASQQLSVTINIRIRLRFDTLSALITPKHRIVWGSKIYGIHTVINQMESNKEIVLMCEENL
ncbi:MAG: phage head closure protein [Thiohalomonadales bacterium]